MITSNSVVADLQLITNTEIDPETVKGRFYFNNGKNETNVNFSETLTAMEKGTDAEGKSEYYFIDETGGRDQVVIQVTQDVIGDFDKIIQDAQVKKSLTDLIKVSEGNITVKKDGNDNLIIKTADGEFNLSDEIKNKETNTLLTSLGAGVYLYENEDVIKNNTGTGVTINVVADVQQNFEEIIKDSEVKTVLDQYIANGFDGNVTYKNGDFYVTHEQDNTFVTEKIEFKSLVEANSESLTTDGVIGVTTTGEVGTEAEKAVLKAVKLSLNNGTVTTEHIKDGTLLATDLADAGKNQVLVTGADQKPVWKEQSKVAPQFFYMPAVIFDTTVSGTATRDLYQDYVNQFTGGTGAYAISHGPAGTTPMQYGGGVVGSAGAPAKMTVFESSELYYYVTYYDEAVFKDLSISADGKLTYTVTTTAEPSSFMNIVFVIK
nr:hypothetical protein [Myroides sp. WP-1]